MRRNFIFALILAFAGSALNSLDAAASCTLPYSRTNGQTADASQVMANYNALLNCLNSAPAGSTDALQYNAGSGSFGGVGPLTNGQLAIGSTGAAPQAATLTAGGGIAITNGPGSVTISAAASPYTPPKLANFTWGNQPSGTVAADTNTGLAISAPAQSGWNAGLLWASASYPATPVTFTVGVNASLVYSAWETTGVAIGDGSGKIISLGPWGDTNNAQNIVYVIYWNSATSLQANAWIGPMPGAKFFAIQDDGTNLTFYVGADLNAMVKVYQASRTAFLSSPSKVGLLIMSNNSTYGAAGTYFAASFGN